MNFILIKFMFVELSSCVEVGFSFPWNEPFCFYPGALIESRAPKLIHISQYSDFVNISCLYTASNQCFVGSMLWIYSVIYIIIVVEKNRNDLYKCFSLKRRLSSGKWWKIFCERYLCYYASVEEHQIRKKCSLKSMALQMP